MNSHLNLFKTYTKEDREKQLENDLTRAFAITLLENSLFLHEVLKFIFEHKKGHYSKIFDDFSGKSSIEIDIQRNVADLGDYDHLFAVSLSESKMDTQEFFRQTEYREYDPVTDLVISIDSIVIIFEVKPNNQNCTAQLYNQAYNAFESDITIDNVTPVDLNWKKLMDMAVKVANFEKATVKPSRFLNDFIQFIQTHNFRWLPQVALRSIIIDNNANRISDRLETAIINSRFDTTNGRLGFVCAIPWAHEILFDINEEKEALELKIYPGNIKRQGYHLFLTKGEPKFKEQLELFDDSFPIQKLYHIKFTSFRRYFTGLWASDDDLLQLFYTKENFEKYTGRKKREDGSWEKLAALFDNHFKSEYNWRKKSQWKRKVINSEKTQFDISFGYELKIAIPYDMIQKIDNDKNDLNPLISFLEQIRSELLTVLIKQ